MCLIRAFDRRLPRLYDSGKIRGSSHAAIGQEAVAAGACAALQEGDYITSTHRGHGHALARGAEANRMMAELLGRSSGYCRGKGGSMHIADFSIGMLGANGVVGGGIGIAAGAALTAQLRGTDQVALCFFGDGAINQGAFHGVANMAAIWRLPLVLLCENNHFAMSARVEQMTAVKDLALRATAYGFPGANVDGMDVIAVHNAVRTAVDRARSGDGPSLIVADCYRFMGHFSGDTLVYRTTEETEQWLARDPIKAFAGRIALEDGVSQEAIEEIKAGAEQAIDAALVWAEQQPLPDPAEAWEDVDA